MYSAAASEIGAPPPLPGVGAEWRFRVGDLPPPPLPWSTEIRFLATAASAFRAPAPARPALLTLQGIYSTTKSVYASYMPASACDLIESLAVKLVTVAAPTLMKVPEGEPVPDLAKLDVMLTEALSFGDAKIDSLLTESTTKISGAYETVKATVTEKVGGAKSFVYGKVEEKNVSRL